MELALPPSASGRCWAAAPAPAPCAADTPRPGRWPRVAVGSAAAAGREGGRRAGWVVVAG